MATNTAQTRVPKLSRGFFAGRRKELFSRLPDNSVAIIVSNPAPTRSNDTEFSYRQSSDVLYLTGFSEPDSVLVFKKAKGRTRFIMFVRPKDRKRETWDGFRHGVEGAKKHFGAVEAHDIAKFAEVMADVLEDAEQIFYTFKRNPEMDDKFRPLWLEKQKPLNSVEDIVHAMRHIKQEEELAIMRHAAQISADAHCIAMLHARPGMREFQVQSLLEGLFSHRGSSGLAYNSIVAAGNNGVTLHYVSNRGELHDGDLLLIDAACEYDGYASDITRTFPVNGKFSDAQREIYQLVLDAQLAALKRAKPGATLNQIHAAAENVLRLGLVKLGILPKRMASRRVHDKAVARAEGTKREDKLVSLDRFFMHGTSHWLGLDVHDVSGMEKDEGKKSLLAPGMVFTVEPGLYFRKDDKSVPARYRGIGIRIEDDVLITATGCEVLTGGVPKEVVEIERLMSRHGLVR